MQKPEIELGEFVGQEMRAGAVAFEFEHAVIILTHEAWAELLAFLES